MKKLFKNSLVILVLAHCAFIKCACTVAMKRMRRIAGHCSAMPVAPQGLVASSGVHATKAHLHTHPSLLQDYADKIIHNEAVFIDNVAREFALKDTHHVFYHGHGKFLCVLQDFLKKLYEWEYGVKVPDDFIFTRWWHGASEYDSVQKFLDVEFKKFLATHYGGCIDAYRKGGKYQEKFDHTTAIAKHLLSTNLSLFGGCVLKQGEDTLGWFWNNKNFQVDAAYIEKILSPLFGKYGFDDAYKAQFIGLLDNLGIKILDPDNRPDDAREMQPQGVLMQIFVPKDLVDCCAYLSYPTGAVAEAFALSKDSIVAESEYDVGKKYYTKCSGVLSAYTTPVLHEVEGVKRDLLQARLLIHDKVILNPRSGVKIFRAMPSVTQESMKRYEDELEKLCSDMFASTKYKPVRAAESSPYVATPAVVTAGHRKEAHDVVLKPILATKAMQHAVTYGDLDTVQKLVAQGFDINQDYRNRYSGNFLSLAIEHRQYAVAEWLLKNGINQDIKQEVWNRAFPDQLDTVKLLVEHGAHVSEGSLYMAASTGDRGVLQYILGIKIWSQYALWKVLKNAISPGSFYKIDLVLARIAQIEGIANMQVALGEILEDLTAILLSAGSKITLEQYIKNLATAQEGQGQEVIDFLIENKKLVSAASSRQSAIAHRAKAGWSRAHAAVAPSVIQSKI